MLVMPVDNTFRKRGPAIVTANLRKFRLGAFYKKCRLSSNFGVIGPALMSHTPKYRVLLSHYARCGRVTLCFSE